MKIAVAGTGYVGLSIATLLSHYNTVRFIQEIFSDGIKVLGKEAHYECENKQDDVCFAALGGKQHTSY